MSSGNCLAKALYDNIAEAPDELAFRKGDILTVLEQNTNSLEGWWLCSLRGRQGIVPGNRLRLLPGMYDPTGLGNVGNRTLNIGIGQDSGRSMRRSWTANPTKVVTPHKVGAVYLYDIPPSTAKAVDKSDSPRAVSTPSRYPGYNPAADIHGGSYDTPPNPRAIWQDAYDEPKSHTVCCSPQPELLTYDSPRSNAPVLGHNGIASHDYDIPSSDQLNTYDVPKSGEKEISGISHIITISDNYDTPQPLHKSSPPIYDGRAFSRSSGDTSTSSSFRSPSGSHSSIETLSLSSVSGSNRSSLEQHPNELYDIPPEPQPVIDPKMAHTGRNILSVPCQSSFSQETYDVPTNNAPTQFYDTPNTRPVRAPTFDVAYDVPPQAVRNSSSPVPKVDSADPESSNQLIAANVTDDKNQNSMLEKFGMEIPLPLEHNAAIEMLVKYQQEVQSAISKLFSFVSTTWRKPENIESKLYDIKITCYRVQNSLFDFLTFAQGALANSAHVDDKTLNLKLSKLIKPLKDSCVIVKNSVCSLDEKGWLVQNLAQTDDTGKLDELDQLIASARSLVEDVRQVSSFIQGNSSLLFKFKIHDTKSSVKPSIAPKPDLKNKTTPSKGAPKLQERPLPPTPAGFIKMQPNKDEFNEYDYVNLESKESVERENEAIKAALPKDMCQSFDELVRQSEVPVACHTQNVQKSSEGTKTSLVLDQRDLQLLCFYVVQTDIHITHLTNAIDAFLATIKNNQPPKVFIGHSKFIIISAHKLVYIGDTVHRNICNPELKTSIMQHSNNLCDSLKSLVTCTKKAATEFPSVVAVQAMVDSVVDVSHIANDLKMTIAQQVKT